MSNPEQAPKTAPTSVSIEEAPTSVRPPSGSMADAETWISSAVPAKGTFSVPAPGHTLAGRYMVFDQLGQGGMGVVLAAYDTRLDRRVALKLLRPQEAPERSTSDGEARLVREAQAMARLNHPQVVAVYDAGPLEDGALFIAMEYVEGQTLRRWCEQQRRPWREVLEAYIAAGKGLAAAHAAGLIHRDFKPDNVLVGNDGRVRVTDFGLARANPGPSTPEQIPASLSSETWGSSLTVPGTLMGTPKYMAPELMRGEPAGLRSDLFAFCVSLYEALYGQLPFPAESMAEYYKARKEGRVTPPPPQSEVPAWVARAVIQGLQADPNQRPASMEALLATLQDDPEVKRRDWRRGVALGSAAVMLVGLAAWGWARQSAREPVCGRVERRLDGIWDASVKQRVRESLLGTGLPYAPDTAERVSAWLDGYAQRWVKQGTELCEAGQAAQLPRLAALQESCLARRRSRLRATTELMARGSDKELMEKAAQAVQSLPPIEDCADARALTAAAPPPEDPTVRAKVEALQEKEDRLEALQEAGKYKEGLEAGEALLREVEPVGHAPLHAQVLYQLALLRDATGDYNGAEELARQALAASARGRDRVMMSRALSLLAYVVGMRQQRLQDALQLVPAVEALAESTDDSLVQAFALNNLGNLLARQGRYPEAWERHTRARTLREEALGLEHPAVAASLNNLGMVAWWMGRYEEAWKLTERSVALNEKVLGPDHPTLSRQRMNLGGTLREMGKYEEARKQFQLALSAQQKLLGPEHPSVAQSLSNLSIVLSDLGRYEEAREHALRSITLREKLLGPEHPELADTHANLGYALMELGLHEEALKQHTRALTLRQKELGPEHALVSESLRYQGTVLARMGRYAEAREKLERAMVIHERAYGKEHPDVAYPLLAQAELLLARGRPAEALPLLERALKVTPEGGIRADVQLALARALWEASPSERPRATALATQSRDYWQRLGHPSRLALAAQWLAAHGGA
jgi:tetratricopeptide (TPR) repeat protein/predicted Ser/Thr protein kinase